MLKFTVNNNAVHDIFTREGQLYLNNTPVNWDVRELPDKAISILYNNKSYTAIIENLDKENKQITLRINGQTHTIHIQEPIDQLLSNMGLDMHALHKAEPIKAPMPGMVLRVLVQPGQQISKGDGLVVLEAMKMENILKAPVNAIVKTVKVSPHTVVEKGSVLIELE